MGISGSSELAGRDLHGASAVVRLASRPRTDLGDLPGGNCLVQMKWENPGHESRTLGFLRQRFSRACPQDPSEAAHRRCRAPLPLCLTTLTARSNGVLSRTANTFTGQVRIAARKFELRNRGSHEYRQQQTPLPRRAPLFGI